MKKNRLREWEKGLLIVLIGIWLPSLATCESISPKKQKTVMIYMCGGERESIFEQGSELINRIKKRGFDTDQINVVAALGGASFWQNNYDPEKHQYINLGGDNSGTEVYDQANMGDPQTLSAFLQYAYLRFPANSFDLVLWGSGGDPTRGICSDENYGNDSLLIEEIVSALESSPFAEERLNLIALDSYMAASLEYALILAPYSNYMIASQDAIRGLSYDWIRDLDLNETSIDTIQKIADETYAQNLRKKTNSYENASNYEPVHNTISVIDLKEIDGVLSAMDDFFSVLSAEFNLSSPPVIAKKIDETLTFGIFDNSREHAYSLYDLGDLVRHLSDDAPIQAKILLSRLDHAVIFKRGCRCIEQEYSGLSVCFQNSCYSTDSVLLKNSLLLSTVYAEFIQRFVFFLSEKKDPKWDDLEVYGKEELKERMKGKEGFIFQTSILGDDQWDNLKSADFQLLLLQEDNGFQMLYDDHNTVKLDNRVQYWLDTIESFHGLYAVSQNGEVLSSPIFHEIGSLVFFPAELTYRGEAKEKKYTVQAIIYCKKKGKEIIPETTLILNNSTGIYSIMNMEDFDEITLSFSVKKKAWDDNDNLLSFGEWTSSEIRTLTLPLDNTWHFEFIYDFLIGQDLVAVFQLTDLQNNQHITMPLHMGYKAPEGTPMFRLDYDGKNFVKLDGIIISPYLDNHLIMQMLVTNISEREAIFKVVDVYLNGLPVEVKERLYGQGKNWSLMPQEEQILTIPISSAYFPETKNNDEIYFTVQVWDASDEQMLLGEIMVRYTGLH